MLEALPLNINRLYAALLDNFRVALLKASELARGDTPETLGSTQCVSLRDS